MYLQNLDWENVGISTNRKRPFADDIVLIADNFKNTAVMADGLIQEDMEDMETDSFFEEEEEEVSLHINKEKTKLITNLGLVESVKLGNKTT